MTRAEIQKRMRLLAHYRKATLVQYMANALIGWPVCIDWDLLRKLEVFHSYKDLLAAADRMHRLNAYLTKHGAIVKEPDGRLRYAGRDRPRRSAMRTKLAATWRQFVSASHRVAKLDAEVRALRLVTEKR